MARAAQPRATDASHDDNWRGGFYELAIKLGPADDERLDSALVALWRAASLAKPFWRRSTAAAEVTARALLSGPLSSVATIPGLGSTLCSVHLVREETYESGTTTYGPDWLDLSLPIGALGNLDERVDAYPFSDDVDTRGWREPIERWFATVASAVFEAVPFVHAITGHEVSGVEPSDVERVRAGVFRRGSEGGLEIEPVRIW